MFFVTIQCFIIGTIKLQNNANDQRIKICFRCKLEDQTITAICLNCKKALYCNRKCMKKNKRIHNLLCRFHLDKHHAIKAVMDGMKDNYDYYQEQTEKANARKEKDRVTIS